uniref:DUF295 domain-containing protein n=1 Tax=Oryza brachyantha TaxID=4533 RepID=J3MPC2_ORYBR
MGGKDEFGSKAWAVQFNGTHERFTDNAGNVHEASVPAAAQGKRCIGRHGEWSLMLDVLTNECFLLASTWQTQTQMIPLPPLPHPPRLDLIFNCAISSQEDSRTVMLGVCRDRSLLYCHPNDTHWSRLPIDDDELDGGIFGYQGKIYALGIEFLLVVDAASSPPVVERSSIELPTPTPSNSAYRAYVVESCGDLFLVRSYLFGILCDVVGLEVYRWNPSQDAWHPVHSIGDRTFFLGRNCSVISSATRAGTQPNCIHLLRPFCDGIGLYTVSLDDMTISLNRLEEFDDDEEEEEDQNAVFWAIPIWSMHQQEAVQMPLSPHSFLQKKSNSISQINSLPQVNKKKEQLKNEEGHDKNIVCLSKELAQWSDLCTDLLELLVSKISFIDFLHLKAVCKQWRSLSSRIIQDSKILPLLLTTQPGRNDTLEVFDMVSKSKYSINVSIPPPASEDDTGASQILHFAKNGWLVLSRGNRSFFLVNPLKNSSDDNVIVLPPMDSLDFKGITFSSVPESPDFVVLAVESVPNGTLTTVKTWRIGDKDWQEVCFENDVPFYMASHNPVFFQGEFYCLDVNARLGAINADTMDWSDLDELHPIGDDGELLSYEYRYSHLMEWKGELVLLFMDCGAQDVSMSMFKLDQSQMTWSVLDDLKDGVVFSDRKNVVARSPPPGEDHLCNKIFVPNFTETGRRDHAFYCLEKKQYVPCLYGLKEPINALWFEPNLDYLH